MGSRSQSSLSISSREETSRNTIKNNFNESFRGGKMYIRKR